MASRLLVAARREWSLLAALATAVVLRVDQLAGQILVGDEWHALEKASSAATWSEIATALGRADHSIPIALYYRLLASTIGLSEALVRAPFLLAGLALVVGLPLAVRRLVGRPAADCAAWLLAVSPVLVFYSRFARPYALTCGLALAALGLARLWWRERRFRYALSFALTVAVAGWFHAAVLPFALAPLAFFALRSLPSRAERGADVRALLGLSALTAGALAVLILPPLLFDPESIGKKAGFGLPSPTTVLRAARIFAGADSAVVALVLALPVLAGVRVLWRKDAELTALFALAGALQCAAVAVIAPAHRSDIFAFARYLLPLLPLGLLALACGAQALLARTSELWRALAGPLLAGLLIAIGPLPATWLRPDNWSACHLALGMLGGEDEYVENIPAVSVFYLELGQRAPGSLTLIEAPWFPPIFANPLPHYQRLHRQRTLIGFTNPLLAGRPTRGELPYPAPGFRLANFVFLADVLGPSEPPADYLVLHRDLRQEFRMDSAPVLRPLANELHADITPLVERARTRFGEPTFQDERLVVFRLR